MISLDTQLRGLDIDDKMKAFLQAVADGLEKLNANLRLGNEPTVLEVDRRGYGSTRTAKSLNLVPAILQVKSIRFEEDDNDLMTSSSHTMTVRLTRSNVMATASGVAIAVQFPIVVFDTDNMSDVNTTRITIQQAGIYIIGGSVTWEANAVGPRILQIRKTEFLTGAVTLEATDSRQAVPGGFLTSNEVVTILKLSKGDYLELMADQVSGGALNLLFNANWSPLFWAHRLS